MSTLPNPGEPEHHVTAWLLDDERPIFEAHCCPDIQGHLSVTVVLAEHSARDKNGRRKRVSRSKLTPEQRERETAAGRLLGAYQRGAFGTHALLCRLAASRRALHYARLGQEPPALPDTEE